MDRYWKVVLPVQGTVVFAGNTWYAAREKARAWFPGDALESQWNEIREVEPEELRIGEWVDGEPYRLPETEALKQSKSQKNGRKK